MKTREREYLLNKAVRKSLSEPEEKRWEEMLAGDAALREEFAEELALERALEALPNAPISSNFTSLVVQAALRAERDPERASTRAAWRIQWPWLRFVPAVAVFLLVGSGGLLGYRNHLAKREEMALNVRSFTEVASVVAASEQSPADVFQNFEAIQRLSLPADGDLDMELLVALQK
jgi:hypothetical protein